MSKEISESELERRINGYMQRVKEKDVERYSFDEKGTYRIISGGKGDYGTRDEIALVRGKFIDVLAYAVQQTGFLGDWCSWDMPDNCNHGYIEKADIPDVRRMSSTKGLIKKLGGIK